MIRSVKATTRDGNTVETEVIYADVMRTEMHFKRSWASVEDPTQPSTEMPTYLAWAALKRDGLVTASFDEWWPQLKDLDMVADDEDVAGVDPS